jgi:hypothetical protein
VNKRIVIENFIERVKKVKTASLVLPLIVIGLWATSQSAVADGIESVVVVTNASDIINGDTSNFDNLIKNPGPDGISFREAVIASNNTPGPKKIEFSPALTGSVIVMGSGGITNQVLMLTSGDLAINGDINGDGQPDITLDGSLGQGGTPLGKGLNIYSSNNTITGLKLINFDGTAIEMCCLTDCSHHVFANNKILNNYISTTGTHGIHIGPAGLLWPIQIVTLSDIEWRDTYITGNTIIVNKHDQSGIGVAPGEVGSSQNRLINLQITGNRVSGATGGIYVVAADGASDYTGVTNPIYYSDNNHVENVTISENIVENSYGFAIAVGAANYGNRGNSVQTVRISKNEINGVPLAGISLSVAGGEGGQRSIDDNLISNV